VRAIVPSPDGASLSVVSTEFGKTVVERFSMKNLDAPPAGRVFQGTGPNNDPTVALSAQGDLLARSTWGMTIRLWDTTAGQERHATPEHAAAITGLAVAPDGDLIATGASDARGRFWRWSGTTTAADAISFAGWPITFGEGGKTLLMRNEKEVQWLERAQGS